MSKATRTKTRRIFCLSQGSGAHCGQRAQNPARGRPVRQGPRQDLSAKVLARCRLAPASIRCRHCRISISRSRGSRRARLSPMYDAPHYKGSDKLRDKVALITGGDSGIGRAVAVLFAREGADIAVAYLDEHEDAEETKRAVETEGRRCILLSGDVADADFCKEAVARDGDELGTPRHPRQQCRVPGARQRLRGADRRAFRPHHQDQSLRLFLHGARRRFRT